MIRALFRKQGGSEPRELEVDKRASLRLVQNLLCSVFAEHFPCMKASIVVRGELFASLMDRPFLNCEDGEEIEVQFSATDDPFFFDLADRLKISLEDEMAWEEARASGSTTLDLSTWVWARFAAQE